VKREAGLIRYWDLPKRHWLGWRWRAEAKSPNPISACSGEGVCTVLEGLQRSKSKDSREGVSTHLDSSGPRAGGPKLSAPWTEIGGLDRGQHGWVWSTTWVLTC
jgi:hypothetical protein